MAPFKNQLLAKLLPGHISLLGPLEVVELPLRTSLETRDETIAAVYFLEEGFASIVAGAPGKDAVEVGVIGREGMTGMAVLQGAASSPFDTYMQGSGRGIRVSSAQLRSALKQSDHLQDLLGRYVLAFSMQLASTVIANARGLLEQRLARWLLMIADRMGEKFGITHEFLAMMLAVQRPGVTLALQSLEARGLIQTLRGTVIIKDRKGLMRGSNGTYGFAEAQYERLFV